VITMMMNALHKSSWDAPRPYFGFEIVLRFLSPSHQLFRGGARPTPRDLARYLRQPHKLPLVTWNEFRFEGETMIIEEEAYQQISVRSAPDAPWTSVRWMLVRTVPSDYPHGQWAVDAVFVAEPDDQKAVEFGGEGAPADALGLGRVTPLPPGEVEDVFARFDVDKSGAVSYEELREAVSRLGLVRSESELSAVLHAVDADGSGEIEFDEFERLLGKINEQCALGAFASELADAVRTETQLVETPAQVVDKVVRALRKPDDPYPLHGSEVAIRYCSPTNRASQLSPAAFSQYLREPWYRIMTEWDEIEIEDEYDAEIDGSTASQDVLIKRDDDDSWTIVNWQLSKYNGRWLTDSLTITE